jgi:hypothetical protein
MALKKYSYGSLDDFVFWISAEGLLVSDDSDLIWAISEYFTQSLNVTQMRGVRQRKSIFSITNCIYVYSPTICDDRVQNRQQEISDCHPSVETDQIVSPVLGEYKDRWHLSTPRSYESHPKYFLGTAGIDAIVSIKIYKLKRIDPSHSHHLPH